MDFDGIIIGGGAAGMLCAIAAARHGSRVAIFERNDRLGKKLLITGKGRCNVTNACSVEEVLASTPRNSRFLFSAMAAFPPEKTMELFESLGCPLKVERGNRVFPQSDKSYSVLDALSGELRRLGVKVICQPVTDLITCDGRLTGVQTRQRGYTCRWAVLATGGVSYPATGSTGDGYRMAGSHGHQIVEPEGSLVPLETAGEDCADMQGLSLRNVGVKLLDAKGKTVYKDFGELLFTHFGVSGPTVLSASAHMQKGKNYRLSLDLKPALEEGKLDERILRDLEMYRNRSMENALVDLLPRSMIPVILRRLQIDPQMQANSLTRQQRRGLVECLKNFTIDILGKRPVAEAIITSGGVKVSQINPKTMESKVLPGLYFAGEIIDCDAYTGGFNLQIAWATAWSAGIAASQTHKEEI
jgi:predicted Rossmann fold flavoprotein